MKRIIPLLLILFTIIIGLFLKTSSVGKISVSKTISEKTSGQYFKTTLSYPESSTDKYPEIYYYISKTKNDFVKEVSSITLEDAEIMHLSDGRQYELFIDYKVATSSKSISYIITTYIFEGGAHGITSVNSFTYDKSGKIININDVLKGDYLNRLSDISRAYFPAVLGDYYNDEMLKAGTEAKAENFSTWYLSDKTVNIIFGDYSIGPYVLGIQELSIDKKEISDIIFDYYK